jgi:hypothetical protein
LSDARANAAVLNGIGRKQRRGSFPEIAFGGEIVSKRGFTGLRGQRFEFLRVR